MAAFEKVTESGVVGWLRHDNRCIKNDKNKDIDPARSPLNYSLTPYIDIPREEHYARREEIRKLEYARYKELKSQFYCYGRSDVNTLCSIVVTSPKEINDPETEEKLFKGLAEFFNQRYGNCVSITIHRDEGKHAYARDKYGNIINGPDGKPLMEWHAGRNHMHYTFIPTVKIDHAAVEKKKNPVKTMLKKDENGNYIYKEKISAKERIDRRELLSLHKDMNRYINDVCGIRCNLNSGITAAQGGNKKVSELKREFDAKVIRDLTIETERLRGEVGQLKGQIYEQQEAITKMNNSILERGNIIKQLQLKIRTSEQSQTHDQEKAFEKDTLIRSQRQKIAALEGEIAATKKAYEQELALKQRQIEELQTKNKALEAKTKELEASKEHDAWGQTNTWDNTSEWGNTVSGWDNTKTVEEVK